MPSPRRYPSGSVDCFVRSPCGASSPSGLSSPSSEPFEVNRFILVLIHLCPELPGSFRVSVPFVQVGETNLREQAVRILGQRGFAFFNHARRFTRPPRELGELAPGPPVAEERRIGRTGELVASRALCEYAAQPHTT